MYGDIMEMHVPVKIVLQPLAREPFFSRKPEGT
jgi:hypothetical protein